MARVIFRRSAKRFPQVQRLSWWIEAQALRVFWWWVTRMDPEQASRVGFRLAALIGPRLDKQRHLLGNLGIAFPSLEPEERKALARRIWGNLGSVLAEYPHLDAICSLGHDAYTEIEVDPESRRLIEGAQPVVFVTAHLANWEIAAGVVARMGVPLSVVYNPQSNPGLDRMLQEARGSVGAEFVPQGNALRTLLKALRRGHWVGLLPDQRADSGASVPYFGIEAPTVTSPAQLAIKLSCPIVPVEVQRLGPARFRVSLNAPLPTHPEIQDNHGRARLITRDLNRVFERWIRSHPESWHCMKRRWPRSAYPSGAKAVLSRSSACSREEQASCDTGSHAPH
jgi:KDO2-lipid IV(A) lauroyltransferase